MVHVAGAEAGDQLDVGAARCMVALETAFWHACSLPTGRQETKDMLDNMKTLGFSWARALNPASLHASHARAA